tara:strand:+ start:34 stop:1953 length:1920 start_codon:yes stop_codon:yes gene_type:complete
MKVPKFTSQTKSSASVGNTNLSIQANPGALSQGYRARANFGNVVSQAGGAMFDMGIKIQEIKNATEAQTVENEVHRVTEDLKLRAIHLPEGVDAEDWMNTELLKVRDAFENGGNYTPPQVGVDNEFEPKTYNLGGKTDWNSAVKKSMNTTFATNANLSSVAMKKINATRYYNQMLALRDDKKAHLIEAIINNQDTPEGQVAFNNLFGSEEKVLDDGTVVPGVVGLLEQNLRDGVYKDRLKGYLDDLRTTETEIAEGFANNLMIQADMASDSEDYDIVEKSMGSLLEYSESLNNFTEIQDDQGNTFKRYELFPEMTLAKRQAIQDQLISKRRQIRDDYFSFHKQKFNYDETEKKKTQLLKTTSLITEMKINPSMFKVSSIDEAFKKGDISFDRYKDLIKYHNDLKSNKNIKADNLSNIIFNQEISDAYDEARLDQLEVETSLLYQSDQIGKEDWDSRINAINNLRNGNDLEFNKNVQFFRKNLKNRIGAIDGLVTLGDQQEEILNNTLARFNELTQVDPVTKKGLSYKQLQSAYNVVIQDFFAQNTEAIEQILSSNQAPLPNKQVMSYVQLPDDTKDIRYTERIAMFIANDDDARDTIESAINTVYTEGTVEHTNEMIKLNQLINMFRFYDPTIKDTRDE